MRVPDPPDFARGAPAPALETWEAGRPFVRVFERRYSATTFHPGDGSVEAKGRWHHFADQDGSVVPVLYGAEAIDCAIAEVVFRDVPVRGAGRVVLERSLAAYALVALECTRDLSLVRLHGHGLRRLGVTARELTDTEASDYARTGRWAAALHASQPEIDGLAWMSRHFNSAKALVLFGDRVAPGELRATGPAEPLLVGPGRALVEHAANAADIAIV